MTVKRWLSVLFFVLICNNAVFSEPEKNHTVYFLIDRSYSMIRESADGDVPLRSAMDLVKQITGKIEGNPGAVDKIDGGFFGGLAEGITRINETDQSLLCDRLEAGRSPIGRSVSEGLSKMASASEGYLVLFSDGIGTDGEFPQAEEFINNKISLIYASFPHPTGKKNDISPELASIIRDSGGAAVPVEDISETAALIAELVSSPHKAPLPAEEPAPPENERADIDAGISTKDNPSASAGKTIPVKYPFGVTAIFFFLGSAGITTRSWKKERDTVKKSLRAEPKPVIHLDVESQDKGKEHFAFKLQPVLVSTGTYGDLLLPYAGGDGSFSLTLQGNKVVFESETSLNINGVSKKKKELKEGDRIALGRYRVFFRGIAKEKPAPPVQHDAYASMGATASLLILGAFLMIFPIRHLGTAESSTPEIPETYTAEESPVQEVNGKTEAPNLPEEPSALKTVGVSFLSPADQVDILFIHSHPDDEAIDFGGSIALSNARGLRTGILLFTDGESGADLYPFRRSDGIYQDKLLTGLDLARVRVKEAQASMSILGADLYIRFGLPNNPYFGSDDVMTKERVLSEWGGEENIIRVLKKAVRILKPDIIVAPYDDPDAHEHFEHKTTGYLCRKAMEQLAREGVPFVYREFIEPWEMEIEGKPSDYPERNIISVEIDEETRALQRRALLQYQTQRDASIIAAEVLWTYSAEWFEELTFNQ